MKKITRKVKKAFTLIELVVVIAVIAILSAVSVGTYFGVMNNAKKSAVYQEGVQLRDALRTQTVTEFKGTGYSALLGTDGIVFTFTAESAITIDNWNTYFIEIYDAFSGEKTGLPGENKIIEINEKTTDFTLAEKKFTVTSFTYATIADETVKDIINIL